MIKKLFKRKLRAAMVGTLDTTMALVIGGIIIGAGMGGYLYYVSAAHVTEGENQLRELYNLEQIYFYKHSKYSADLKEAKYQQKLLATTGGDANYQLEIISATNNSFVARATSVTDFDGDGVFSVLEINQENKLKEVVED